MDIKMPTKPLVVSIVTGLPMFIGAQAIPPTGTFADYKGIMEYGAWAVSALAFAFFYWLSQKERQETEGRRHTETLEEKKVEVERTKADIIRSEASVKMAGALADMAAVTASMQLEVHDLNKKPCMSGAVVTVNNPRQ